MHSDNLHIVFLGLLNFGKSKKNHAKCYLIQKEIDTNINEELN